MPKHITKLSQYRDSGDVYPHGEFSGDPAMVDEVLPVAPSKNLTLSAAIDSALKFKGNQSQLKALNSSVWWKLKARGLLDHIIPLRRKPKKPLCPHCGGSGWASPTQPCLAEGCRE